MARTLRPASELRESNETRSSKRHQESVDRQMDDVIARIEDANRQGKREINILTVMTEVENELKKKGYKIAHYPALGMGDMDSISISWDRTARHRR